MTSSTNQKITASSTGRFSPGDFYADSTLYWISLTPRVWSWNYIFFEVICFFLGGGANCDLTDVVWSISWGFDSRPASKLRFSLSRRSWTLACSISRCFFFLSSLCGKSLRDIQWRQLLPLYHSQVMSSIRFHWTVSSSVVQWSGFKVHRRQPRWKSAPPSLSLLGGGRWRAAALVNSADVACVSSAHR